MTQYVKAEATGKPNSFGLLKVDHKDHGLAAPEPNREIWEEPAGRFIQFPKGCKLMRRGSSLYVADEDA